MFKDEAEDSKNEKSLLNKKGCQKKECRKTTRGSMQYQMGLSSQGHF